MEGEPLPLKDAAIIDKIGKTLLDHEMALQDEFERHERWLLTHGFVTEPQYSEAVTEYRRRFQSPQTEPPTA